ncbi:MnhB domain-containing protein [Actinopolymorpha rutila]|uniref:Multicomponent Na+:H+ antiporter subunit B n=1 Tax=Actinopolymorpha rutila TaxID=446787 RepID=A0A852ZET6_9ACTN|nr:MnhB domain-containing protein [Actinopolymorpha rutila]NYH91424.1 multicomponent Na+:H+ antiporter subunit B [Actinopolymorpha rutila]
MSGDRPGSQATHRPVVGAVLSLGFLGVLVVALLGLPGDRAPLPAVARQALEESLPVWHSTEPVNVVVYGVRGFDTFGETFLLLAAVVGVVLLARTREPRAGFVGEEVAAGPEQLQEDPGSRRHGEPGDAHGAGEEDAARAAERAEQRSEHESRAPATPDDEPLGTPAPERAQGMSVVVRGGIRTAAPLLAVMGLYLVAWGYSPGGGFPAGAVLLGVVLLVYAALGYGAISRVIRPGLLEPLELAGALAICALGLVGLAVAGAFWANWLPLAPAQTIRSGGIVQAFSVAELVEVSTGLTLAVFGLLGMRHDWAPDPDTGDNSDNSDNDDNHGGDTGGGR